MCLWALPRACPMCCAMIHFGIHLPVLAALHSVQLVAACVPSDTVGRSLFAAIAKHEQLAHRRWHHRILWIAAITACDRWQLSATQSVGFQLAGGRQTVALQHLRPGPVQVVMLVWRQPARHGSRTCYTAVAKLVYVDLCHT